jgi:hypothetical protein
VPDILQKIIGGILYYLYDKPKQPPPAIPQQKLIPRNPKECLMANDPLCIPTEQLCARPPPPPPKVPGFCPPQGAPEDNLGSSCLVPDRTPSFWNGLGPCCAR